MAISGFRVALPQVVAVSIKNIILIGELITEAKKGLSPQCILIAFGATLGFPSLLIPALQEKPDEEKYDDFFLNKDQISWISSINLICVPLGCVFSGSFTAILGRRLAMQLVCLPILGSWIIFYYSQHVYHLYIALCLSGFTGE